MLRRRSTRAWPPTPARTFPWREKKWTKGKTRAGRQSTWLIHLPQPVSPIPSLLPVLLPASLFSIKCQDWPFYNHICDLGSGIQMQSMSIRIMGLLIERGDVVWGSLPILILTNTGHIITQPRRGSGYSCLQVIGTLLAVTAASYCLHRLEQTELSAFAINWRDFFSMHVLTVQQSALIQDMVLREGLLHNQRFSFML